MGDPNQDRPPHSSWRRARARTPSATRAWRPSQPRHHRRLAPLLDRRPVPRAQRLALQPQPPARAALATASASRPRTIARSRPRTSPLAHARRATPLDRRWSARSTISTVLHLRRRHQVGFGVLRDPIACKPAVMAETDRLDRLRLRISRAVNLPGIDNARGLGAGAATAISGLERALMDRSVQRESLHHAARIPRRLHARRRELNSGSTTPTARMSRASTRAGSHAVAAGLDGRFLVEIAGTSATTAPA